MDWGGSSSSGAVHHSVTSIIPTVIPTPVIPTPVGWGGSSSDGANRGEGGENGDEGLGEHHWEGWVETVVILKLWFRLGNNREMSYPSYTFSCETG